MIFSAVFKFSKFLDVINTLHPSSSNDSTTEKPRPLEDAQTNANLFLIPSSIIIYL